MGGLFNPEGKFMRYGGKLWDMMWLNVLTLICSIPLITAGPAFAAMHYVLLKIYRDEETSITKLFFKSFAQNFKQGAVIQLVFLVLVYLLYISLQMFWAWEAGGVQLAFWVTVAVSVAVVCIWMWSLILLSRYTNSVINLFKTALAISAVHPIRTLFMAVLLVIPGFVLLFTEKILVFVLVLGLTGPGMVQTLWYNGIFKKMENVKEEQEEEEEESEE